MNLKLRFLIKSGHYIVPSPSTALRFCKGESLARSSEILFLSRTLHQQESKIDQPTRCTMVQKLKFRFEKIHKPYNFQVF